MGDLNPGQLNVNVSQVLLIIGVSLVAFGALEGWVLSRLKPGRYDWREHHVSLSITLLRGLTDFVPLWFLLPGGQWLYQHRLFDIPLNTFWGLLVLLLSQEFCYYWFHRASHRVRWFWANHAVHHSPNQYTLAAAYRIGITGKATGMLLWFLPMCWLGFTPVVVISSFVANLLFQFWIHAEWIPKLGWLEGILNTPSAHRVHHAANLEYLDANYGGVLLIYDRLFGTYVPERDDIQARYGWVQPIHSGNPLKVCLWQYLPLWRDVRRARSLRELMGYLFAPPGWAPDGQGQTTEDLRRQAGMGGGAS
jgi:sterol desaturase/sphingolipid hydroxylase (fatty acid hydroxylase superfamily)